MLKVTRGRTGRALVDALAEVLVEPLADPLAPECVVVHSRGMERWLSQQLAAKLGTGSVGAGVCANVDFPSPDEVVGRVMTTAGTSAAAVAAWRPDALTWRLLDLVDRGLPPSMAPLHQRVDAAGDRRLVPLRHLADHLHGYALHRPDMVLGWLDGDVGDGVGGTLDPSHAWQAEAMRLLAAEIGLPSYPEAVVDTLHHLAEGAPVPAGLSRLALFGFTALPAAQLAVLSALGKRINVDLMVLHPSPGGWAGQRGVRGSVTADGLIVMPRRQQATGDAPVGNRLLTAWGRDVTELQALVQTVAPDSSIDRAADPGEPPTTLLAHIQQAITTDVPLSVATAGHDVTQLVADGSVQLHACHGPARQVQVLRDEILRLLQADPTLRPRDILVMCPDVETFAPLVMAHLAGGGAGRTDLRVRLADRALRATNPLLRTLASVLDAAATRITASRLRDLLGSEPVSRRFGMSPDDLEEVDTWLDAVGFRWGLDADERARFRLPGVGEHSLDEGLSRLLLGVAMADEDDRTIDGITPFDHVEGSAVRSLGRLAEFAHRLTAIVADLRDRHTIEQWATVLGQVADRLMLAPADDPGQRLTLTGLLQTMAAAGGDTPTTVGLEDIRDLLADQLRGQPSRANHMTGDLTVCTLVPMRSVPHRVVCLLGMDDEVFPRRPHPHVDDLLAHHPRMGEADSRTEDRQLLLDAVMAAEQAVLVTYTGVDERTGDEAPPAVPIAELLRVVDSLDPAGQPSAGLIRPHPLHAHSQDAFRGQHPSFDRQAFRTARVVPGLGARPDDGLLPPPDPAVPVDVEDLVRFAVDPGAAFARQVLGIWLPDDPEIPQEHFPVDLVGLDAWKVGEALLRSGAAGDADSMDRAMTAIRGRGLLPPDPLSDGRLPSITSMVDGLRAVADDLQIPLADPGSPVDVDVSVAGRRVTGRVPDVLPPRLVGATFSTIGGKQIMRAWVRLVVMTAADPEQPWCVDLVGKQAVGRKKLPAAVGISPLGNDAAARRRTGHAILTDLLSLYDEGRRAPLIAPAVLAHAYASTRLEPGKTADDADQAAASEWDPNDRGWSSIAQEPVNVLLLGDVQPYEHLAAQPPRPEDSRLGHPDEPHRFGGLAMRLWAPILARVTQDVRR